MYTRRTYKVIYSTGIEDSTGAFESLVSLTYWTTEQLSSGDFGKYAAGITDVS